MAEIADSFGDVWTERTILYEQVLELRAQLTAGKAAIATLRDEAERTKADHEALLAELEHAQAQVGGLRDIIEQLGANLRGHPEEKHRYFGSQAVQHAKELDRVYREVAGPHSVTPGEHKEPRKTLRETMVDALKESALRRSERPASNGSNAADLFREPDDLQDAPTHPPEPAE